MAILSRRLILLAILLYEQFIHYTQINLRPNKQLLVTQQQAYQSFLVTSWFDSVCVIVACWVNFSKNVEMKLNYRYPTAMYESILAQMYVFLVLFTFLLLTMNIILAKIAKKYFSTRNKYIWAKLLLCIVVREV